MKTIDDIQNALERDGYCIVQHAVEPEQVQAARAELTALAAPHLAALREAGFDAGDATDAPLETALLRVYGEHVALCPRYHPGLLHTPGFRRIVSDPTLLEWVTQLLGPELRLDPRRGVRSSLPTLGRALRPWRQTAAGIAAARKDERAALRAVCFWLPLVPARPENGALRFVRGSHQKGLLAHVPKGGNVALPSGHPAIQHQHFVDCIADPGDLVVFNPYIVLSRPANLTETILWAASWTVHDAAHVSAREAESPRLDADLDDEDWAACAPVPPEPAEI